MTTTERPRRTRRRHPAAGTRIAAAGLSVTTMLTLVTAMGATARRTGDDATAATAAALPGRVTVAPGNDAPVSRSIVLTARPVVRAASASSAPIATTNGSR